MSTMCRSLPVELSRAGVATTRRCFSTRVAMGQRSASSTAALRQPRRAAWRIRATETDEDKEVEAMKRAAEKGDLWSGDVAGILTTVGGIAAAGAVIAVLAYLVQPMFDYTISSFPGQR